MGLMNQIGRGISAAAGAGAEIYARGAAEDQRASIQAERDARLAELQEQSGIRAEARKNEPLNRISRNAQGKMAEEVPLEAAPVTNLSGVNEEGKKFGFQGDLKAVRAAIDQLPESADKTAALAQLQGQVATDTKTGLMNVAGKTRKRTSDEALDAAVQDAKVNDLPAYADYESRVGKPLREERRIDVTESRNDARAVEAAKESARKAQVDARRYEVDIKRLDIQQGTLESGNRKIDAWIANESEKRDNDASKADGKASSPERLYSIVNAMNTTIKNLDDANKGRTPEEKAEWQRQKDTAVRVRDRASNLLDSNLSDRGAPESQAKPLAPAKPVAAKPTSAASTGLPPGAKQIGTSGGKPVFQLPNGEKVIQN